MTIEDQIRDEKLQYDINREATKISALSSGKIDKYKYLTGEEILPLNKQQIIEQAKFTYSPLGKGFEKQTKTIEDQGEKQMKAIEDIKKQLANIQGVTIKNIFHIFLIFKFYDGREKVLNAFASKSYLKSNPSSFKILTPNQMLKRLPIV